MENISNLSLASLKNLISEQKLEMTEKKEKIEKFKLMKKYRQEHLDRLEKKQDSLKEEKKYWNDQLSRASKEFDEVSGAQDLPSDAIKVQSDLNKALAFVKQTPNDGLKYLIDELHQIQSELQGMNSASQLNQETKKIYQVHFRTESCLIRTSNYFYTFQQLAQDAAIYFSLNPEDCLLKDENGSNWPFNARVMEEYSKDSRLVLALKHGKTGKSENSLSFNWEDLSAELKLETRLERMRNWVLDKGKTGKKRGEKKESILKSVCFFLFYFSFLIMLYITVFSPISLRDAYQLNYSLTNMFVDQNFPQDCSVTQGLTITLSDIVKPGQFFCWMQMVIIDQLFNSSDVNFDENKIFILRYNQLGGFRLKQSRVKLNSCDALNYKTKEIDSNQKCFAEYDSTSKSTTAFGYFKSGYECQGYECEYLKAFRYSENPPQSYEISGKVSNYDKTGFFIDSEQILINKTLEYDVFSGLRQFLQDHLWIDHNTRAILIHLSFYNINYNYFTNMEILFEISAAGHISTRSRLSTLHLNYYYDSWLNMKNSASSFFDKFPEIFCYIYAFFCILPSLVIKLKRNPWVELKKMWTYMEIILLLLMLGIVMIRMILFSVCNSILSTISNESFSKVTDFSNVNFYLSISWALESFAVLLGSLNLLHYFSIQSMTIIWDTLQRGAKSIFAFFIVFIVLICSFTQMVHIIYGNELSNFTSFGVSISALFMILLGSLDSYEEMSEVSPVFTPIFYIGFMFLMFFVIMNIFVAILNEAYSVVVDFHVNSLEKELVDRFKTRLFEEIKLIFERVRYFLKKCLKRQRIERSIAFKAFNRN